MQILATTDGGAHWATVTRTVSNAPVPGTLPLGGIKTGLSFRDADTGWATGEVAGPDNFSWLYRTSDGGHSWQHQTLTFPVAYQPVSPVTYPPQFFTPSVGILPVALNSPNRTQALDFFTTRDGGKTWTSTTPLPFKNTTMSPTWDFGDANHGWAVWGKQLHMTADGGRHWRPIVPNRSFEHVTQLNFVNARVGWGYPFATDNHSLLLRTTNGGRTWTQLTAYANDQPAGDVQIESAG